MVVVPDTVPRGSSLLELAPTEQRYAIKDEQLVSEDELVGEYQSALRSYRELKQVVGQWRLAFTTQHGRQPEAQDAMQFGGQAFAAKYAAYCELRKRLIVELPKLREHLELLAQEQPHSSSQRSKAVHGPRSARRAAQPQITGVTSWLHADRYRHLRRRSATPSPPALQPQSAPTSHSPAATGAVATSDTLPAQDELPPDDDAAATAAASAESLMPPMPPPGIRRILGMEPWPASAASAAGRWSNDSCYAAPLPPGAGASPSATPQHQAPSDPTVRAPHAEDAGIACSPGAYALDGNGLHTGNGAQAHGGASAGGEVCNSGPAVVPARDARLEADVGAVADPRAKNALLAALKYKRQAKAPAAAAPDAWQASKLLKPPAAADPVAPLVHRGDTSGAYSGRKRQVEDLPESFMLCP